LVKTMNTTATSPGKEEKKVEHKDVRILVIDDEPMMADSLKQNLVEEGYSVDSAATGAEAIELFDQGGHHLAVCDLQLPDMDGLEVMRHMKDARPTTEVIVVTGYGSVQKAVEATKAGAFYFVEKPFDFEEIQPLVEKALERRELVAETTSLAPQNRCSRFTRLLSL
jgi:DNA-binding NtrC family response regulator